MKSFAVVIFSLFLQSNAHAWQLPGVGDFKFEAVTDNVYVMHGPNQEPNVANQGFMNNPAAIISSKGVILIDPGSSLGVGNNVLSELKKVTDKPVLAVFNTHIHGDHWLANDAVAKAFPEARIYAHERMKNKAADQGLVWLDLMQRLTEGLSAGTELVIPHQGLKQGERIEIDGQRFQIYSTLPAHTDTDIMIEHLNSQTIFLGDNGFRDRFGQFDGSSAISGNIEALQTVMALEIKTVVPGHGFSGTREQVIKPYLDYLILLNEVVETGFEADMQGYEIKQAELHRFNRWQDWRGFDAYLGKHIDKMYLEVEEKGW